MMTAISFDLHHCSYLLACVLGVPFVDDIPKRGELVIPLLAVHTIIHGDKVNIMLREHDLRVHAYLQIVTAKPGHILDDDPFDDTSLNIRDHLLEARAVEGSAGNSVVDIETDIFPTMVKSILL